MYRTLQKDLRPILFTWVRLGKLNRDRYICICGFSNLRTRPQTTSSINNTVLVPVIFDSSRKCQRYAPKRSTRWWIQVPRCLLGPTFCTQSISDRPILALGLEGSANKLGAGVIQHLPSGSVVVLSNLRHTYITPPGEGFLPRDTAQHHRQWALKVIRDAIEKAGIRMKDLDCICYTKGILLWLVSSYCLIICL